MGIEDDEAEMEIGRGIIEELAYLERLLNASRRRLQILERVQAQYGDQAPSEVLLELEDHRQRVRSLQLRIRRLKQEGWDVSDVSAPPPPAAPAPYVIRAEAPAPYVIGEQAPAPYVTGAPTAPALPYLPTAPLPPMARGYTRAGLLIGLPVLIFSSLGIVFGGPRLLFGIQMCLLTIGLCLTPTVVYYSTQRYGRVVRIVLETVSFVALLAGFSLWLSGIAGIGIWLAYAFALILVLEIGGHVIERSMLATMKRVSRNSSYRALGDYSDAVQRMYRGELILYISVPSGLLIGTITGLLNGWLIPDIAIFCTQLVLLLASSVLVIFLIWAFVRMGSPLFRVGTSTSPNSFHSFRNEQISIYSSTGTVLKVLPSQTDKGNKGQPELPLAYIATDLRKVYLYDSVHNIILLVAFVVTTLTLWNYNIEAKWIIVILLALSLVFSQLPYVIGQALLHEKVLERYEGEERAEVQKKLKENAPLFPTVDFLAALTTTGTAGGLVYFLLDEFIKNALKP